MKGSSGLVIAESEETAVIFGMPQQAIRTGVVDLVLPLGDIAASIQSGLNHSAVIGVPAGGRARHAHAAAGRGQV